MSSQYVIAPAQFNDSLQVALYKLAYYLMTAAGTASSTTMLQPSMAPNWNDGTQTLTVKAAYWAQQLAEGGGGGGAFSDGTGSPEGVVTGDPGDRYYDTAGLVFYTKVSGDATNTGWAVG